MIGQMAITIALPGFAWISMTPIFILMDRFLYQFSKLSEKNELYQLEV